MRTRIRSRKKQIKEEWKRVEKVERKGIWYDVIQTGKSNELYVSNHGRIKRININGLKNIVMGHDNGQGYLHVKITYSYNGRNISSNFSVHRLVAYAFLVKPIHADRPNHLDNNGHNNAIWNLEWTDASGNNKHGYDIGAHRKMTGETHPRSKLSNLLIHQICRYILLGKTNKEIILDLSLMDILDDSVCHVSKIRNKKIQNKISDQYFKEPYKL